ncbi:16685_t:CDS:1, partial [Gigaspora rosea]
DEHFDICKNIIFLNSKSNLGPFQSNKFPSSLNNRPLDIEISRIACLFRLLLANRSPVENPVRYCRGLHRPLIPLIVIRPVTIHCVPRLNAK